METFLFEPTSSGGFVPLFNNVAYIIGAGASCESGYPLVRDFLSEEYLYWAAERSRSISPYAGFTEGMLKGLDSERNYIRQISDNVEFALSSTYGNPESYRRVVRYVFSLLSASSDFVHLQTVCGSTVGMMTNAIYLLEQNILGGMGSVISFNYDLCLEAALSHALKMKQNHVSERDPVRKAAPFDYGFEQIGDLFPRKAPRNWFFGKKRPARKRQNLTGSRLPADYQAGIVPVLKLHGSVNLLFCPVCEFVAYMPHEMLARKYGVGLTSTEEKFSCPGCGIALEMLIVPPGKRKEIPRFLEPLWRKADEYLGNAETIVFVGYSLPEYDVEARELISRNLRSKRVLYIDPCPDEKAIQFLESLDPLMLLVRESTAEIFFRLEVANTCAELLRTLYGECASLENPESQIEQ